MWHRCGAKKTRATVIKLGTGAGTYNVAKVYPNYASLTRNNFIIGSGTARARTGNDNRINYPTGGWGTEISCSKTYNANTGMLTISNGSYTDTIVADNGNEQALYTYSYAGDIWLIVT